MVLYVSVCPVVAYFYFCHMLDFKVLELFLHIKDKIASFWDREKNQSSYADVTFLFILRTSALVSG